MKGCRGFTLVELLVATAMMGLLAAAGYAALAAGTSSAAKTKRYGAMIAHGQAALEMMAADIRSAVAHDDMTLVALDAQYGGMDTDTIDFVAAKAPTLAAEDSEATGRCEVGYYIENDEDTEAEWLVRREDGSIDDDLLEGGAISLAGPYVVGLNIEFYDGVFWESGWDYEDFPEAVAIQIVVVDEDGIENPIRFSTTVPIMAR